MFRISCIRKILFHQNILPEQITLFVTSICNLMCQHCFLQNKKNDDEFDLQEIKKVCETIDNFSFLSLTGGEPFLRKDLPEIVKLFIDISKIKRVSIPTNGFFTDTIVSLTEQLLKVCKTTHILVKVSFDGLYEEHDRIRGVQGSFKKAVETFLYLKRFSNRYKNFRLGVLLTFSGLNQYNLYDTYVYVRDILKPDVIGLNFVRGDTKVSEAKQVNIAGYTALYRQILYDLRYKTGYEFYIAYKTKVCRYIDIIFKEKRYPLKCYAGRLSCVIDNLLNVFPCELLGTRMGNLRDYNYNFKKLWYSQTSKNIRKYILENNCCCTHECNLQVNMFFNIKHLFSLCTETFVRRVGGLLPCV
ncbi:MAG: radical SAM protein [Endomicrobia bacterium]|nr:radical SAM protein [Endomicrobiia bacterium]